MGAVALGVTVGVLTGGVDAVGVGVATGVGLLAGSVLLQAVFAGQLPAAFAVVGNDIIEINSSDVNVNFLSIFAPYDSR